MAMTPNADDLKAQARRLRDTMAERGTAISHSVALEVIARQYGARDWNTLAARTAPAQAASNRVAVGGRVAGRYLNQSFAGNIIALTAMPTSGYQRIVIHFDEPVDVVTFESFSAFRQRVTAVIDKNGVSPRKTSNGLPHLVLTL